MNMTKGSRNTFEWFENYEERGFGLKDDETGEDEARFIRRVLRLRKGRAVLDAPCGAGRIAIHLARSGLCVTGVDLTASYIRRARRRFRWEKLPGEFLECDMREISFDAQFNAVVNWQGSFGFFSDLDNLDVLRRFARALKPGGRALIDQPNREFALRHFRSRAQRGGVTITAKWNPTTERAGTIHSFVRNGKPTKARMSIRLYTPGQFRRLFEQAGLEVEAMYGNLDGSEYSRGSPRIYIVGRKI